MSTDESDATVITVSKDLYNQLVGKFEDAVEKKTGCNVSVEGQPSVNSVYEFINKAECNVLSINSWKERKERRRIAIKHTTFRNFTPRKAKFTFKDCVTDSTSVTYSETKGWSVSVLGGLSPSSPYGGGGLVGAAARYSSSKSSAEMDAHTTSKELLAEVELLKGEFAVVTKELYITEYDADCELELSCEDTKHQFVHDPKFTFQGNSLDAHEFLDTSFNTSGKKCVNFRTRCKCVLEDFEYELHVEVMKATETRGQSPIESPHILADNIFSKPAEAGSVPRKCPPEDRSCAQNMLSLKKRKLVLGEE